MEIKIATRKSPLALYQAEAVKKAIIDKHPDCICELIPLDSEGDKDLRPIHELGGKGVFVKRLEEALVMGDADIAVHSLKDVPADLNDEFQIVATLERANPSDSIIFKESITLDQLKDKSIVATSSPRRAAQVKLFNPSLEVCPVRGNIHTRIKKLKDNEFDVAVFNKKNEYKGAKLKINFSNNYLYYCSFNYPYICFFIFNENQSSNC